MDDDDEEDESDDAIPEEAVIDKFLDMSTYIEPRSGAERGARGDNPIHEGRARARVRNSVERGNASGSSQKNAS